MAYSELVSFDLICKVCLYELENSSKLIISMDDDDIRKYNRDELIDLLDDFSDIKCFNCQKTGHWLCANIYCKDQNHVLEQLILKFIRKENDNITIRSKPDCCHDTYLEMYQLLSKKVELNKNNYHANSINGKAVLAINLLDIKNKLSYDISIFYINGISIDIIKEGLDKFFSDE